MRRIDRTPMRHLICTFFAGALIAGAPAHARMYQWLESGSGLVRLSGDPPPWYRNHRRGPRTLVYENGRLVDDTAIELPSEREEALRNEAFREADLKREEAAIKKLERATMREARLRKQREIAQAQSPASKVPGAVAPEPPPNDNVMTEELDAATVEKMKRLIQKWDKQQKGMSGNP